VAEPSPIIDSRKLAGVVEELIGRMPHPKAPSLTVADYRAYEVAAGMLKNPERAQPQDVVNTYHQLKHIGLSPADFEHTWELARPVANRILGRDPRLQELALFTSGHPGDVHEYYMQHPLPGHEEVKAGDFLRYFHAATPIAQASIGRKPLPVEVARFAAAGYGTEDIVNHYAHEGKGG
jgi:hypothetical protein